MKATRTELTYRYERIRAVAAGVLETAGQTFLLLIAVRAFEAGATAKALIASGSALGLLLGPVAVTLVGWRGWTTSGGAARLTGVGAACFFWAAAVPVLPVYVVCALVGVACVAGATPLFTQIYQDNYPSDKRGSLFSRQVMIRVGVMAVFSHLAGELLTQQIERYRALLMVYGLACALAAYWTSRIPSERLHRVDDGQRPHPFRALGIVAEDRVFRWTLICWMMMGFANLMMLPLRVEYLANARYGLEMATSKIALVTGVIPSAVHLVLSPVWGRMFDRMNFFLLRVVLNMGFALGILAFFTSDTMAGLVLGAVLFGVAQAGGSVAWSLWVTKFAPPHRVADYMSVHTFFTGLRGLVAPFVAFHVVQHSSMGAMGAVSAVMIVLASLILVREYQLGKAPDPAVTLVKEASGE